jgi:hypothetical protein
MLRRMSALIAIDATADETEVHRRHLLAVSDGLLEQVEELRLSELAAVPPALADAIRALQVRLGRVDAGMPRTLRAAHQLVFAVQARLMAANPRNPRPRPHADRPAGAPRVIEHCSGSAWKFLSLPARPPDPEAEPAWRRQVEMTVQRALDRWTAAQDQAVGAARVRCGSVPAVARARAAWTNYWELRCEADALLSDPLPHSLGEVARQGRRGGAAAAAGLAARPP